MKVTYNYEENSWLCKQKGHDGKDIYICATQCSNTKKGPLIHFAVLVGSLKETGNLFFEIEIFTKKPLQAKQFAEYCKQIISCYNPKEVASFSREILAKTRYVFWRCDVDIYYRSIGIKPYIILYAGIRHKLFRAVSFWETSSKKFWPAPSQGYPVQLIEAIEEDMKK